MLFLPDMCLSVYSVTVHLSEVLPRGQNWIPGHSFSPSFLVQWNKDADRINRLLYQVVHDVPWMKVIEQAAFRTNIGNSLQYAFQ